MPNTGIRQPNSGKRDKFTTIRQKLGFPVGPNIGKCLGMVKCTTRAMFTAKVIVKTYFYQVYLCESSKLCQL